MTGCNASRATRPSFRKVLFTTASAMALLCPAAAFAQDSAASDDDAIVVTGFRQSLSEALDAKRDSDIRIDVIVAEDMAKFPDLNLAESLQRLPGVQINREAGEGRRISLRGLGPDFARVQLNGMEVLGNVDSAQDSRGQRSRDRAFDFNIFASELFSRVEVEKTFQAAQKEGGMAGTVGLFTAKPFDYNDGINGAISLNLGTNTYTEDAQPRVAALLSQNWDDAFGIAVSVAWSKRNTTEQGHNTYNYTTVNGEQMQALVDKGVDLSNLSASQQADLLNPDNTFYFADGNRLSSWNAEQERLGITAAVQWQPSDDVLFTIDALHGRFTTDRSELHLATRPLNSRGSIIVGGVADPIWPANFQTGSVVNDIAWDEFGYVTYADVTGVGFGTEHRRSHNENRFWQVALTNEWNVTDTLTFDGHVGWEKSTYDTPYDDKFYIRARGNMIADYGPDGRSATFSYAGWDSTDPSSYALDNFYYRGFNNESELLEGEANLAWEASPVWTIRLGGAYHSFRQQGIDLFYDANVNGTTDKMRGDPVTGVSDVFSNEFGSWLIGDYAEAFDRYDEYHRFEPNTDGTGGALQDIENVYETTEDTISGYLQADWDTEVGGMRLRGNVGLRGYSTDTKSVGWIQGDSYAYLGTSEVEGSYSGVLPAMNAVLEVTDDVLLRFAATKNLNRPSLGSMAAEGTAFLNEDSGEITVRRGNPNLKPYTDTTFDFAVEYYFGDVGLLSAGVFHKIITNFIGSDLLENIPFSETGVPFSTIPGATADTIVTEFTMPVNIEGDRSLTGIELAAQSQLSFLPAPLDGFGVIANFTYIDADEELTGFSDTGANGTIYYETDRWGLRGSMSYRSRWYTGKNDTVMSASTRGFEGSTYFDASAFFNVTDRLQINVNAINLTNEKDTQFWGQNRYLYNQNQSGTTILGGVNYKF
ncbi:TonB-dependent receptor [Aurantiacibacter flavus]|uniref:TonB-dependent receptor n=1 Tax=Aurantiacibacter flavus TaxID=3145232 RepID=A0ABV0CVT9_9SPHN